MGKVAKEGMEKSLAALAALAILAAFLFGMPEYAHSRYRDPANDFTARVKTLIESRSFKASTPPQGHYSSG